MGVVAPWRLALLEHSACSLPVVLLISRAGSLPLAPPAPAGIKKPKKKATGAAKKAAAAAKARE